MQFVTPQTIDQRIQAIAALPLPVKGKPVITDEMKTIDSEVKAKMTMLTRNIKLVEDSAMEIKKLPIIRKW